VKRCLPSKYESLSSSPNAAQKKRRERDRARARARERDRDKQPERKGLESHCLI
jgi:hypothetical protein